MRLLCFLAFCGLLLTQPAVAQPLVLVDTFTSVTNRNDNTGRAIALSDQHLLIGTSKYDRRADPPEGAAKLYDLEGRVLRHDFLKPSPIMDEDFGDAVALSGTHALVCGSGYPPEGGYVVLYDLESGKQIHRLQEPGAIANERFGWRCALSERHALIGEPNDQTADGYKNQGAAHLYDVETGALIRTFAPPIPQRQGGFGSRVALWGKYAAITARIITKTISADGAAFVFNVESGELLHTFKEPIVAYTSDVAMSDGRLLVGHAYARINGRKHTGAAAVYDLETGEILHLLTAPDGIKNRGFGASVALAGKWALIGAQDARDKAGRFSGMAFLFDVTTGELVQILTAPAGGKAFPSAIALSETRAALGAYRYTLLDDVRSGAVFLYEMQKP